MAISVIILLFSNGFSTGWNSPSFPVLQSEDSPLPSGPITEEETSWILSSMSPGCLLGSLLFGWIMEQWGRKVAGYIIIFDSNCGYFLGYLLGIFNRFFFSKVQLTWVLVLLAQSPYWLVVSKFLVGFSGGGSFILAPIYITEISETR